MIQLIAAANHAVEIAEVHIGFHGTNNSHEPITVSLKRQTSAGTMSALTLVANDDSVDDTLDTTAQHTATAEPTTTTTVRAFPPVHPQTGLVIMFPEDSRPIIGAGDRMGLVVTAANNVNCDATIVFVE
jgi:hypothetical protein